MWILPKNYQMSSRFALDMVASKEDLMLPGLNIESSLMWRSKPSPLRTWLARWKRVSYLPHLFTRILKPSQRTSFETALTSSLAVTHANPFQQQESDLVKMTQGTCGHTSESTSKQYDLFAVSLKTSKVTSRLDSPQSSAIWKKTVISQRGEYSVRVKSALLTNEKESTSWLTPMVQDSKHSGTNLGPNGQRGLLVNQVNWPTPSARDHKGGYQGGRIRNGKVSFDTLDVAVQYHSGDKNIVGHLNPEWVEWLMGVPIGWTGLGSWGTE